MDVAEKSAVESVLVVDDEFAICRMVSKVLQGEGFEPVVATRPEEALSVSKTRNFRLAFVDIKLPEMSGFDLAVKLKENRPLMEIVFMTGYGTLDSAVRAIKVGAYDFLRKPFNISELKLCVKRFQERETLKEQVRLAERHYFHLVQHIPLLIFVMRKDLQLEFVNNACSVMLGYSSDEAVNVPHWLMDRIHQEDRRRIQDLFENAFSPGGTPFSTECRFFHRNGRQVHTIIKSIPWLDAANNLQLERLEGIVVDITDRVFLEKALVQREKLNTLGAISAEVAHEIRNPLVAIGGFARRLQSKFPDLSEIEIILDESQRLEKILDRIRNYLKPVEVIPQECSVNSIILNSVNLLAHELDRKQLQYCLDFDSELPKAYIDPDILGEVVMILIRKIEEMMAQGANLLIRSFESDQNLHIEFKSTASGFKVKNAEHLFLPFDEGGQSIGLPFAYRLLKNMSGLLSFTQDEIHTTFTVTLPKSVISLNQEVS